MLSRAGIINPTVLKLAEEALMSCAICRKYVRLPNRPQLKTGEGAPTVNH